MRGEKKYKSEWSPGRRIASDLRSPGMPSASLMKMPCHAAQRMALHGLAAPKSFGGTPSCRKHLERSPNGIEAIERSPDRAGYTDANDFVCLG